MREEVFGPNGNVIGYVEGRTFIVHKKPSHFFRKFQGFGLSRSVIEELSAMGVKSVLIAYHDARLRRLQAPLEDFRRSRKRFRFGRSDVQHFVSIVDMEELS